MSRLSKLVDDLPLVPGVYLWKDEKGEILYIGKAKELRKRVKSYLRKRGMDRKTWELMERAHDLETIVTNTEKEALLLEATLIRKHQPKYNLALKDDRRHTWVRVDRSLELPTFAVTRDAEKDGANYFGPFGSTKRLQKFLDTVRQHIPVANCIGPSSVKRACMDYHLDRCSGPCEGHISKEAYCALVEQMCLYLDGKMDELASIIQKEMVVASENLEFEKAANLRDRLEDLELITRRQKVVSSTGVDRDVLGIARTEEAALVEILIIRGGRMIGHDHYYFEIGLDIPDKEVLTAFIEQYYFALPRLPKEVLLPKEVPNIDQLVQWLNETNGSGIQIFIPSKDDLIELVEMANKNAHRGLRKILLLEDKDDEIVDPGVKELKAALSLRKAPLHIEGFDIANIQGTDPTGSCVVFKNGRPSKSDYRMFRVRVKDTPDDYAMMKEVVYRRYRGVLERGDELPDMILIDGGKGQLNVAIEALERLGLDNLTVTSIAKRLELLYSRDHPDGIALDWGSAGLHLVQRIRDEAHRFAQKYHHKLREKRVTGSILEEAPGIGPKRRSALLQTFGSYDKIRQASVEFLASVEGMTIKTAKALREWIDKEDPI